METLSNNKSNGRIVDKQGHNEYYYLYTVCKKHEYVEVKLTTNASPVATFWLQCKHCGKTIFYPTTPIS